MLPNPLFLNPIDLEKLPSWISKIFNAKLTKYLFYAEFYGESDKEDFEISLHLAKAKEISRYRIICADCNKVLLCEIKKNPHTSHVAIFDERDLVVGIITTPNECGAIKKVQEIVNEMQNNIPQLEISAFTSNNKNSALKKGSRKIKIS